MKPLIRYTVGPVSNLGLEILKESIKLIRKNYNFDVAICYNQIEKNKLEKIDADEFINQEDFVNTLPYPPIKEIWKICPPRLRINSHEIFIDNDLIIINKIPQIDEFLNNNSRTLLFSEYTGERHKVNGKEVPRRYYGQYDKLIDEKHLINGGLFGVPPNFDFENKIKELCLGEWKQDRKLGISDCQGIITTTLIKENPIIIPEEEILNYDCAYAKYKKSNGYHFIEANRNEKHKGWELYKSVKE